MKIKSTLFLSLLVLIATHSFAVDGYLANLSLNSYVKANTNYTISANLLNNSNIGITSCTVSWSLDNGSSNTTQVDINGGLTTGYYVHLDLDNPLNISVDGYHTLKVWVAAPGETNFTNDTITRNLVALSDYVNGKVLIEEYTGTWCPNCPYGTTAIDTIAKNPNAIPVSFHGGDVSDIYEDANGMSYMNAYFPSSTTYFPSAIVNMGEMASYAINTYTSQWPNDVSSRIGISPVDVKVAANYTPSTAQLKVTVTANFKYALTGTFIVNAYVIQNNISGTQATQYGYKPWIHNHVMRKMLGGPNGNANVIPSSPVVNTDYTKIYTVTLPVSSWNMTNIQDMEVIAYVYQRNNGNKECLNVERASFITGVENITNENSLRIYPNPMKSSAIVVVDKSYQGSNFILFDILGNEVKRLTIQTDVAELDRGNLQAGLYIYKLTNNKGEIKASGKLIVVD